MFKKPAYRPIIQERTPERVSKEFRFCKKRKSLLYISFLPPKYSFIKLRRTAVR